MQSPGLKINLGYLRSRTKTKNNIKEKPETREIFTLSTEKEKSKKAD